MRKLLRPFLIFLAIVFLFEAWLWDNLAPVVGRVVDLLPWRRMKSAVAVWVDSLPPPATLIVFAVPLVILIPIKLLGLWLIAQGQVLSAAGVFILAKLVGLGVTSFVFDVTREKLLLMAWFRGVYYRVLVWRRWADALVAPIQRRIRRRMRLFMPRTSQRALRLLLRIRRRMHAPQPAR